MKFAVGVMLSAFGIFWCGEGARAELAGRRRDCCSCPRSAARCSPCSLRRRSRSLRRGRGRAQPAPAARRAPVRLSSCPRCPRQPRSARASARSSTPSGSSSPTSPPCTGRRCCSGCCSSALNLTIRSRAFFNSLRAAYPAVSLPVAADLGRLLRRRRLQQRRPRARRRRDQAVPHALLDPRLALSDGRGRVLRGVDLRRDRGRARADLRLHPGRLPEAARLLQTELLRHLLSSPSTSASRCS